MHAMSWEIYVNLCIAWDKKGMHEIFLGNKKEVEEEDEKKK